jgi:Fe-S-cluster containining protein
LSESEAGALAARLELDAAVFRARFTRTVWRDGVARFSLIEKAGDCVFWRAGEGCAVYDQRPRQCRTWPFWRRVVASPGDWAKAAADCPGMNRGEFHDAAAIATITADDGLGGGG